MKFYATFRQPKNQLNPLAARTPGLFTVCVYRSRARWYSRLALIDEEPAAPLPAPGASTREDAQRAAAAMFAEQLTDWSTVRPCQPETTTTKPAAHRPAQPSLFPTEDQ